MRGDALITTGADAVRGETDGVDAFVALGKY
jgi:hypothetical protein